MKRINITPAIVESFHKTMERIQDACVAAYVAPRTSCYAPHLQKSFYILSVFRNRAGKTYIVFNDNGNEHCHLIPEKLLWNDSTVQAFMAAFLPRGRAAYSLAVASEVSGNNSFAWVSAQYLENPVLDEDSMNQSPKLKNKDIEPIMEGLKTVFNHSED